MKGFNLPPNCEEEDANVKEIEEKDVDSYDSREHKSEENIELVYDDDDFS